MWHPKLDVYRTEWLDLVFDKRNKSYGAYELRQHNGRTTIKALLALPAIVSAVLVIWLINFRINQSGQMPGHTPIPETVIHLRQIILPNIQQHQRPTEVSQVSRKAATVKGKKHQTLHVVPADVVEQLFVSIPEVQGAGPEPISGAPGEGVGAGLPRNGTVASTNIRSGNEVVGIELLEKYPEFPGGERAFAKYLSRNLRYPLAALEANITGRVLISFIIEKDGSLSDVKVLRGIGGGCDEEAVRVFEKAPAWSPGLQNGKPVRVAYTMPIYFSLQN